MTQIQKCRSNICSFHRSSGAVKSPLDDVFLQYLSVGNREKIAQCSFINTIDIITIQSLLKI